MVVAIMIIAVCMADINVVTPFQKSQRQLEKSLKEANNKAAILKKEEMKRKRNRKIVKEALKTLTQRELSGVQDLISVDPDYYNFEVKTKKSKKPVSCDSMEELVKAVMPNTNSTTPVKKQGTKKAPKVVIKNKCNWKKDKYVYREPKPKMKALINTKTKRVMCPVKQPACTPRVIKIDVEKETANAARAIKLINKAEKVLKGSEDTF